MITENVVTGRRGGIALSILLPIFIFSIVCFIVAGAEDDEAWGLTGLVLFLGSLLGMFGLIVVQPNEAKVLVLFGTYKGSVKLAGWYWVNPFLSKKRISMRVRNFETEKLKVNDLDGNPIEIAAVVVWKVTDTAEACFEVDDYVNYVHVQSESALRNLATHYTYDSHGDDEISLRGSTDIVAGKLNEEIQDRLQKAGVEVLEARISHLAYAPEIAEAMLRRQQAGAIIAAREKIVEGAVSMVQMALDKLAEQEIVELDEERKAAMVSNLLVVLCSEHSTQPVLNTGSLYT
ncbi:MAG: SPFH domain-containing protein [Planctomycetota bacterium]|jgi:regulator of protease activity HflC (stomatin/prohibitin superfamily)